MKTFIGAVCMCFIGALFSAALYTTFVYFFNTEPRVAVCLTGALQTIVMYLWGYTAGKTSKE